MPFQVLDNKKPADKFSFPKLIADCWSKSIFETFEAAAAYASDWLGEQNLPEDFWKLNTPYDYNGYGDTIEIRECD